uniref:Uncharacterized protein n=1 Tax=viral metagenome TaxID=1070528 RepID=A0A6C0BKM2_9ZZZZ
MEVTEIVSTVSVTSDHGHESRMGSWSTTRRKMIT